MNEEDLLDGNDSENEKILKHLFNALLKESERGAVIIGTTKVEEQLSNLVESILPRKSKKYKNRILHYPGTLSSFSSKIELAYAFRLIDEKLYISLNSLREIRNRAAHSSDTFTINEIRGKFESVFDLGNSFYKTIQRQATKAMKQAKSANVKAAFANTDFSNSDITEALRYFNKDGAITKIYEKEIPFWELTFGLTFICSLIKTQEIQTKMTLGNSKVWSDLSKRAEN